MKLYAKILILFLFISISGKSLLHAQQTYFYPLSSNFEESSATGPDLIVIENNDGETGNFGDFDLPITTCPNEDVVPGYFFERDAGFEFSNNEFLDCEYTIQFAFKFDDLNNNAGWVRIMSFTHVDDVGIYIYQSDPPSNGTLDFWPNGLVGEEDFFNDTDVYQLTLIRECNGLVNIYINGESFAVYDDSLSMQYLPQEPDDFIVFFRDHPSVLANEASPGWVKNLYVADYAWDSLTVAQSWDEFCDDLLSSVESNLIAAKPLELYPNPSSKEVFVSLPELMRNEKLQLRIIDMTGRTIFEQSHFSTENIQLDIEGYSKGLYFIEIQQGEEVYRGRFQKM
ncbi:MAG: T9SS C-terminal target domain-containing protein, partial [Chitinophagaceae bacterium]